MQAVSHVRKGKRPLGRIADCLLAAAYALGVWIASRVDAIAQGPHPSHCNRNRYSSGTVQPCDQEWR
jgi:hypothetical protein